MKLFIYTAIFAVFITTTFSQSKFYEISTGPGYQDQSFFRLNDGANNAIKLTNWDIAFTSFGTQDAGIHFNEASGLSMGQPTSEIEVYDTKSSDFTKTFELDSIKSNRIYNDEKSWSFGAFNSNRNAANPFDYGWGKYVPSANKVSGDKVFVIKLKSGKLIKFLITELNGFTYNFKYADLNGSNEVSKSIVKTPGAQKLFYYSFTAADFVEVGLTGGYDLIFTRYTSIAQDPNSPATAQYNVTGILTAPGNTTAAVTSQNPAAELPNSSTTYSKQYDLIGYTWKNFTNNEWSIDASKVFFIKSAVDKHLYKIQFIDFEGASTGTATMEVTDLGIISSTNNIDNYKIGVYPNPTQKELNIILDVKEAGLKNGIVIIRDVIGRSVFQNQISITSGMQAFSYDIANLSSGVYHVSVLSNGVTIAQSQIIKQ